MSSRVNTVNDSGSSAFVDKLSHADRTYLARAITIVENNLEGRKEIFRAIEGLAGNAQVVGVTGPPGVGKSTLIDACIVEFRKFGQRVAVVAIDPSSHISGGAILGDRVRMAQHADDDGVFIRSIASRGHLGGLSATAMNVVNLFDAAKWDTIIVETVGIGQSEIQITNLADITVVVESPGLGDDVQAIKAGILEIADIVVVNKADLPNAQHAVSNLLQSISLRSSGKSPKVMTTTATSGEGVKDLVAEICQQRDSGIVSADSASIRVRRIIAKIVGEMIEKQLIGSDDPRINECMNLINAGDVNLDRHIKEMTEHLLNTASAR